MHFFAQFCFFLKTVANQKPSSTASHPGGKSKCIWIESCHFEFGMQKWSTQVLLASHLCLSLIFLFPIFLPSGQVQGDGGDHDNAKRQESEFNKVGKLEFMTGDISLWNLHLLFSNHTHREIYWHHETLREEYIWSVLNGGKKAIPGIFVNTPFKSGKMAGTHVSGDEKLETTYFFILGE